MSNFDYKSLLARVAGYTFIYIIIDYKKEKVCQINVKPSEETNNDQGQIQYMKYVEII